MSFSRLMALCRAPRSARSKLHVSPQEKGTVLVLLATAANSISPSNDYSGLISFSVDWFDLPAVQGTLQSLFQHHSSKASILQHSAFFMAQLSHPYMTTGKPIAFTRQNFVGKEMSLLFNMLPRFVIAFLLSLKTFRMTLPVTPHPHVTSLAAAGYRN